MVSQCFRHSPRALLAAAVLAAAIASCADEQEHSYVANVSDPLATPTMSTTNVSTLISDSGYTRYHITAPLWNIYDDIPDPMWKFPKGLNLVNFDLEMKPAAAMRCDSATYFSQRRLWRLDGNIVMVNVQRDTFLTEQLYWDQNQCKVYSDSFIHIVRANHIIEGYGFESNQEMTQYNVNRPTAIIPVDRSEKGGKGQRPFGPGMTAVAQDSLPSGTPRPERPLPPERASRRRNVFGGIGTIEPGDPAGLSSATKTRTPIKR